MQGNVMGLRMFPLAVPQAGVATGDNDSCLTPYE